MTDVDVAVGWYPDPTRAGRLRYWDGAGWTLDTASPSGPKQPRPPRRFGLALVAVSVLAALLGGVVVVQQVKADCLHRQGEDLTDEFVALEAIDALHPLPPGAVEVGRRESSLFGAASISRTLRVQGNDEAAAFYARRLRADGWVRLPGQYGPYGRYRKHLQGRWEGDVDFGDRDGSRLIVFATAYPHERC